MSSQSVVSDREWREWCELSPDLRLVIDLVGGLVWVNHAFVQLLGYCSDDLPKLSLSQITHPDHRQEMVLAVRTMAESGGAQANVLSRLVGADGRLHWVRWSGRPVFERQRIYINIRDVTETVEERQHTERVLRSMYEATPVMMHGINAEGRIEMVSEAWLERLGYQRDEVIGHRSVEFLTDESKEIAKQLLGDFFKNGRCDRIAYEFVAKDGSIVNILLSGTAEYDSRGDFVRSRAVLEDVTEQRRTARALEEQSALVRGMFDAIPDVVVVVDTNRRIVRTNSAMETVFGYPPAELVGQLSERLYESREAFEARASSHAGIGDVSPSEPYEQRYCRRDGTIFPAETVHAAIQHAGKQIGFVGLIRDITARVEARDALLERTAQLERSNEELAQFAYVASHDLQEPLRMVSSYMSLLDAEYGDQLQGEGKEYLRFAVEGAERMRKLIRDLLAYSRSGRADHPLQSVALGDVIEEVLKDLELALAEANVEVVVEEVPKVAADPGQLHQLLSNLLTNAVKFRRTSKPKIWVGAVPERGMIVLTVRDNGIGFEPRYAERIFGMFQRLHTQDAFPGTGIGLAQCKRIAQRHGGRIWAESKPGEGTAFHVTLLPPGTKLPPGTATGVGDK